jgi:hypothetical protein
MEKRRMTRKETSNTLRRVMKEAGTYLRGQEMLALLLLLLLRRPMKRRRMKL